MNTETFAFVFEGSNFEARVLTWREEAISRKARASELMHGRLRDVHVVYQNLALIRATLEFAITKWPPAEDGPGNFDIYFGGWTVSDDAKNIVIEVNGKTFTFRPLSWWEEFVTKVAFAATLASDEGGTLADMDRESAVVLECQSLLELAVVTWPKDCQSFHDSFSSQGELLNVTRRYQKALQDVESVRYKQSDARSAERMADRIISLYKAYEVKTKPFRSDEDLVSGDDAEGGPEPSA